MSTSYSDIRSVFLDKITEYKFTILEKWESSDIILGYMNRSISKFKRLCKVDLTKRNDALEQFEIDLDYEIIDIITDGMVVEWLKPFVMNSEILELNFTTRDIKDYSPANQLKEIRSTYELNKKDFEKRIKDYSFYYAKVNEWDIRNAQS